MKDLKKEGRDSFINLGRSLWTDTPEIDAS